MGNADRHKKGCLPEIVISRVLINIYVIMADDIPRSVGFIIKYFFSSLFYKLLSFHSKLYSQLNKEACDLNIQINKKLAIY